MVLDYHCMYNLNDSCYQQIFLSSSFVYPLNENNASRIDRKLSKRANDLAYDIICYDVFGKKARGLAVSEQCIM